MKWPTLKARLTNPIMTEEEALRQLKRNGRTLTKLGEDKLKQYDMKAAQKSRPKKSLQPADKVVQSLIALRDELFTQEPISVHEKILFFKINSCLYREYPHKNHEASQN
jgi:hypothetical protein